jgi:hypothetical protein
LIILVAPFVQGWFPPSTTKKLLTLFAHDAVVRKTAVGSAIGVLVAGLVFFRPAAVARVKRSTSNRPAPPADVVGA